MGGRGAASGSYQLHGKQLKYGDEYETLLEYGNIKYVKIKNGSPTAPMETMPDNIRKPKGRVYALIGNKGEVKNITFYDSEGKKRKQIDLDHEHGIKGFHAHIGYKHESSRKATSAETRFANMVLNRWKKK